MVLDKIFFLALFFVLGLFMGRVSALLAELFSVLLAGLVEPVALPPQEEGPPSQEVNPPNPPYQGGSQAPPEQGESQAPPEQGEAHPLAETLKRGLWPFIVECQNTWGWMVCSYPYKKLKLFGSSKLRKTPAKGRLKTSLREAVPLRPFVLEVLIGLLFALLFHYVGWKFLLIEYLLFAFALVTASAVDWEYMILPDSLTLSGIGIGLLGALLNPEAGREFLPALGGMLMGGGFLWIIAFLYENLKKEEGLGGGDIKLLAWIGAVLTWKAVPFVILLSCGTGLVAAFFMLFHPDRSSKHYFKQSIPFGPYLAFSALVYILWGQNLAQAYLSWFFYF